MELTEEHYQKLLGLEGGWEVEKVQLCLEKKRVDIDVGYQKETGLCPECSKRCPIYDTQASRTWRHLDTMQLVTILHSSTPRTQCPKHGVLNIKLPWAAKHSRFTLLFEAFSIEVLKASRSVEEARKLLGLNWHQVEGIKKRAVERGLARREHQEIAWVGMDEKSFRKGHRYVSLLNDLEGSRVLEVVEGRDEQASQRLLNKGLNEWQREMVCGAALDMWAPFCNAVKACLPHADIVHDRFHISKYLNEAVDKVRRKEHAQLTKQKDDRLKGTKYLWLKGFERLSDEALEEFSSLKASGLNVTKAWEVKELFNYFWGRRDARSAEMFFANWFDEAMKTGLAPVKKVAAMLKKRLGNLLTYFSSYISNAVSEGLNSKIQTVKSNARGFRTFENYRISILFYCGKLNLAP